MPDTVAALRQRGVLTLPLTPTPTPSLTPTLPLTLTLTPTLTFILSLTPTLTRQRGVHVLDCGAKQCEVHGPPQP